MNERSSVIPTRANEGAILDAALTAFGTQGFNGASMREVAKGAGTSLSNLYNYFPSKAHLLAEVLRHANAELAVRLDRAVTEAGDDASSRMREAVRAYVGYVLDHQLAMVVSTAEVRYLRGEERERLVAGRDENEAVFTRIVDQGVGSGEFRSPFAADATRAILSTISAIAFWYRPDGRLSRGQLAEQHARYALAVLEAPLPR